MPDPSPSPGRPAASRNRPRSPEQSDEATRPAATGRPRRASKARAGKAGGETEPNEPRWRDIQWVDFTIDDKTERPIDPSPSPEANPAPAAAFPAEHDGFAALLLHFRQPARGNARADIPGLAPRFGRIPVPRPRPGAADGQPEPPKAEPEPTPIERKDSDSAPIPAVDETPPATERSDVLPSETSDREAYGTAPSAFAMFAERILTTALRLAGNDRERLQRWLTVTGSAIVVAVAAYVIGAMLAGLTGSDARRHSMSDQPVPHKAQLAAKQPTPQPTPAQPPATATPPSEPAARAAFYLARAKAGDPVAQYDVGVLYAQGDGFVQDYTSAASWFHAAAAQGNLDAEYNLGVLYERGLGVTANATDAVNWYRSAADQNNARAQYNLALAYAEGRGTEQDFAAAARWYKRAAEQGLVPAMVNLAILYELGQGVDSSLPDAYAWYSAAADRGDDPAKSRAGELFGRFSDKDKATAQGLAATVSATINGAPPA